MSKIARLKEIIAYLAILQLKEQPEKIKQLLRIINEITAEPEPVDRSLYEHYSEFGTPGRTYENDGR